MGLDEMTRGPVGLRFLREIGIVRGHRPKGSDALVKSPVHIETLGGRDELLILDRMQEDSRVLIARESSVRPFPIEGLLCPTGVIKSIRVLRDGGFVVIAGDRPREISLLDENGFVARRLWTSDTNSALNWPSFACPWMDGILVGDQSRRSAGMYRPAGLVFLSSTGEVKWEWRPGKHHKGLGEPTHLTVAADGSVIITDMELHRVIRVKPPSELLWAYGDANRPGATAGRLSCPSSASMTPAGTILIADTRNNRLVEVSLAGLFLRVVDRIDNDAGLNNPAMAIALERDQILVADAGNGRVVKFGAGAIQVIVGRRDPDRRILSFPRSVQSLRANRWLVADTNNNRVIDLDASGRIRWQYGGGLPWRASQLAWPRSARVAWDGQVAISDSLNSRVLLIRRDGTIKAEIGHLQTGTRRIELHDPHDALPTSRRTLIVADASLGLVAETDERGVAAWVFDSSESFPLCDPHQLSELNDGRVRVADPYVGVVTLNPRDGSAEVWKKLTFSDETRLELTQPKAILEWGERTIIADCYAPEYPIVIVDANGKATGFSGLVGTEYPIEDERYRLHHPRSLARSSSGRLIISDFEAHRLVEVLPQEDRMTCLGP